MKIVFLLTLSIALNLNGFGQYFNKSYDFLNNIDGVLNIEHLDSNFLFFSGTRDSAGVFLGINTFSITSNGVLLDSNFIFINNRNIYLGWANSTSPTKDGGFIIGGGIADTSGFGFLIKLNKLRDTLWTKTFGDTTDYYTFRMAIQSSDGGYVAVGETSYPHGTFSDGWLVKTDSLGNKLWERNYGQISLTERLSSVYQCRDGGYILGGGRRHFGTNPNPQVLNFDPMIIKVNAMGVHQWTYIHNTQFNDAVAYVIQTLDGNYVFGASTSHASGGTGNGFGKASLLKIDSSGNLMWHKEYGFISNNHSFQRVLELPDSSLIAVGRRKESTSPVIKGLMVHTDKNGDSLFVATYENNPNGVDSQNYLWDVVLMDDGGFMAAGEVIALPPALPYKQDAWVIRVDSNGCIISNCLVGEKSLEFSKKTIDLYPNPSTGIVNIESEEGIKSISVYDMQGSFLKHIKGSLRQLELPTEKGLYLIRIETEKGQVLNRKVVKQ
ncbi:MAG: T9SS C-terminal target domain-containing protein [Bacteroidetes bacterium]|nr:MAG: T9SS C-terminal target domain-containing protein [Bacteroidota bacterium]MBL1143669.1 T9SS C-terminal target domain-containing protein [Bacteroidota bacterium]NOG56471.1 T9SS type A sorting domain-containing protein [Bacteroidota bacterium]